MNSLLLCSGFADDFLTMKVADQLYNILHKHCNKVQVWSCDISLNTKFSCPLSSCQYNCCWIQAVSCDEAFLDVTDLEGEDPELLASKIRKEIFETTGCTASTGIAGNMLMARLATRTAKPNGQCYIPPEGVCLENVACWLSFYLQFGDA